MPFLDPQLIYGIIKKKNKIKDIFFPKYPILELLDKSYFSEKVKINNSRKLYNLSYKKIEINLKKKFLKKIRSLN